MVFGFFKKVSQALSKTRGFIGNKIRSLFRGPLNEELIEQLEEILYEADLGVQSSLELTEYCRKIYRKNPSISSEELIERLQEEMLDQLQIGRKLAEDVESRELQVFLIVGVNGNGKTTSVAKLAKRFQDGGKKVLIAATDTFRAAGIEQLEVWAQRLGIDLVKGKERSDPAAVAFDALTAAKARGAEVLLIDTAGRLHTKKPLMQELEKIKKICAKMVPGAPQHTLLVLDATTGQNALDQAEVFHSYTPISGLILTKLDGSAKGGIVFRIYKQLGLPIEYIGVGEGEGDLLPFEPKNFIEAIF